MPSVAAVHIPVRTPTHASTDETPTSYVRTDKTPYPMSNDNNLYNTQSVVMTNPQPVVKFPLKNSNKIPVRITNWPKTIAKPRRLPLRITSCRSISNFPINYKSHNPLNCTKIKTTTSNTSLPSLFISNARSLVNKIDELSSTVSNYSADIVVITETWLFNNVDSSVISLNGFSTFRHDRPNRRRGGGVCV